MKQRFSSLDVKAVSLELAAALAGLRVSNIYDLSSRIFLFKLAKPDVRKLIVVDAGFRCHLTEYSRTTASAPSPFVSRLRKFLKTRRVTGVSQVGTDRIIHFTFSDGQFHLFLEFFAAGNIILTDNEYKIIALLRNVPAGTDQDEVRVGLTYSLSNKQNYSGRPSLSQERIKETLDRAKERGVEQPEVATSKRAQRKQAEALRRALSQGFPEYPPALLEHALHAVGYDTSLRPEQVLENSTLIEKLMSALQVAEEVWSQLDSPENIRGFIVAHPDERAQDQTEGEGKASHPKLKYADFHPFEPRQFQKPDTTIIPFDGFNKAVDEFFSSVEAQKLESRLTEREETAKRKLEAARKDQEKRLDALREAQALHTRKAQTIEANLLRVEEAINAVNGLIAQGMDWVEIARLIEMEQAKQNPVAKIIKLPLKLYENTITLLLSEPTSDEELDELDESEELSSDEEEKETSRTAKQQPLAIDIDLGLSPWANARQYYEQKKTAAVKEEKTLQASKKAIKSAERKITEDLKQGLKQEKAVLRPARTPFWFEKFLFFISSDGYLVLGGRDAAQSEMLYLRHLKRGDVYVHADVKGAIPMIIKNRIGKPNAPIPPSTLSQAGTFSVATSTAWDSKALMGAWWVKAEQVSKTTDTGDYVATGDVVIRGEKNHLAPGQLILGFAVLFQISQESVKNHTKHRVQEDVSAAEEPHSQAEGAQGEKMEESKSQNEVVDHSDSESSGGDDQVKGTKNPLLNNDSNKQDETDSDTRATPGDEFGGEKYESKIRSDDDEGTLNQQPTASGALQVEQLAPKDAVDQVSETESEGISDAEGGDTSSKPSNVVPGTVTPSSAVSSSAASKQQQRVRGKRGKAKKIATKYKDQDEEDRELALRLLGSAPKKDSSPAPSGGGGVTGGGSKGKSKAEREAELEAQKQRRRLQHERAVQAERRRQEALQRGEELTDGRDAADEADDLKSLPALVGTPVVGDEVLAAIPVCAPWSTLGQYKYRTKLQPGTVKKGKAVREIIGRWVAEGQAREKEWEKARKKDRRVPQEEGMEEQPMDTESLENTLAGTELELIKGWKDAEVVNTLPVSNVRIVAGPGGAGAGGGKHDAKGKGKKSAGGGAKGGAKGGKGGKKK
ncbi:hypothetical protein VTO42DRAFT_8630 [Malbranchea cinnamomea]